MEEFRCCDYELFTRNPAAMQPALQGGSGIVTFCNVPMDFKQTTIDDLIENEHQLLSTAIQRYGAYYTIALDVSEFLFSAVKSVDRNHAIFVRFLS